MVSVEFCGYAIMSSRSFTFVIDNESLDADHEMIVGLWRTLDASRTVETARTVAMRLMDEATGHFAREEEFMRQCGFPQQAAHRASHQTLAADLRRVIITSMLGGGPRDDFVDTVRALANRWVGHIVGEDSKLAPYGRKIAAQTAKPMARKAG
jgi:hemerythrin